MVLLGEQEEYNDFLPSSNFVRMQISQRHLVRGGLFTQSHGVCGSHPVLNLSCGGLGRPGMGRVAEGRMMK